MDMNKIGNSCSTGSKTALKESLCVSKKEYCFANLEERHNVLSRRQTLIAFIRPLES
jgi:hypothetical protein